MSLRRNFSLPTFCSRYLEHRNKVNREMGQCPQLASLVFRGRVKQEATAPKFRSSSDADSLRSDPSSRPCAIGCRKAIRIWLLNPRCRDELGGLEGSHSPGTVAAGDLLEAPEEPRRSSWTSTARMTSRMGSRSSAFTTAIIASTCIIRCCYSMATGDLVCALLRPGNQSRPRGGGSQTGGGPDAPGSGIRCSDRSASRQWLCVRVL